MNPRRGKEWSRAKRLRGERSGAPGPSQAPRPPLEPQPALAPAWPGPPGGRRAPRQRFSPRPSPRREPQDPEKLCPTHHGSVALGPRDGALTGVRS